MLRLRRRLRKLEAQLTDSSGFRPHSQAWLGYWEQRLHAILAGEEPGKPGCIPLEVWDAVALELTPGRSALDNPANLK
jgi:hypothetical protein